MKAETKYTWEINSVRRKTSARPVTFPAAARHIHISTSIKLAYNIIEFKTVCNRSILNSQDLRYIILKIVYYSLIAGTLSQVSLSMAAVSCNFRSWHAEIAAYLQRFRIAAPYL